MNIGSYLKNIKKDEERNNRFLHLTANENQLSNTARIFLHSKIAERYYFGGGVDGVLDFGGFIGMGFKSVEELVDAAKEATNEMLHGADCNLNVLSGVHAMMCAILSTTEPGDIVMTVPLEYGGHFATKGILDRVGRKHVFADYDLKNLKFDVTKIAQTFREQKVRALYLDVSYYLNPHNLSEIREAIGPEPIIIYDASHTMGLIMGQTFQAPFKEGADVICANTHKTLPGPHKGMVAFKDKDLGQKANAIIDGSLYSTPHITHLIALSITILELKQFGEEYARQIIKNSNAVAEAFVKLGYEVRKANTGRYSENHQAHIFLEGKGERLELFNRLVKSSISTNFDSSPLGGQLFIRLGTAEVTRRGMKENEMAQIVDFIDRAFNGENVKEKVESFNHQFSHIHYSFDKL